MIWRLLGLGGRSEDEDGKAEHKRKPPVKGEGESRGAGAEELGLVLRTTRSKSNRHVKRHKGLSLPTPPSLPPSLALSRAQTHTNSLTLELSYH